MPLIPERSLRSMTAAAVLLSMVGALDACNRKASGPSAGGRKSVVPVVVAEVRHKDVPLIVRAIGRVTPPAVVSVKPQVTGSVFEVHFTDGQAVKKGDLLFTLDKRPFQAALDQARASLAEAQAKADNAAQQAKRYESVARSGSVSTDEVENLRAASKAAQATAMVAAAAVKSSELQLEYCIIRSPIDGRAGKALVTAGNVVEANKTELVVVNQIAPVEVTFTVAEQQLPAIQRAMASGIPKVIVRTSGAEQKEAVGKLTFVDNTVKPMTGTLELKAAFDNQPQVLWPGQFVGLRVQVGMDQNAVVAPAAAVQSGQDSPFVFIVKEDKSVELRPVEVDRTEEDDTVIRKGLSGGEKVVIDGQSRLTTGATVNIIPPNAAPMGEKGSPAANPPPVETKGRGASAAQSPAPAGKQSP